MEPSSPAVTDPPWFADDPVARGDPDPGRLVVSPVPNADRTWDELARADASLGAWCGPRWLGAWRPLVPVGDTDTFVATRGSWHAVAEHVLVPFRHRACGKIGLRFTTGGFGTPFVRFDGAEAQLRVDGGEVVMVGHDTTRVAVTTLRAAAEAADVELGGGTGVYEPTTALDPDLPLVIDAGAAARLADWFGFSASILEELRSGATDGPSTRLQLWPEHFDLSVDLGDEAAGQRATFGASPGDDLHRLPYLYVTHWANVPDDPFWNDTGFGGASIGYEQVVAAPAQRREALAFFETGRARLRGQ